MDEAALARNVIDRSWAELLGPLDYAQIAPPGFLWLAKAAVLAFGTGEYALRLVPLLSGFLVVCLSWELARRLLGNVPAVCAAAFVGSHTLLIDFSATVKQYSGDAAAAVFVALLAVDTLRRRTPTIRRTVVLGVAGAATVLFSFAVVFVLAGAAITAAAAALRSRRCVRHVALVTPALWIAGAIAGVFIGRAAMTPADAAYMHWFWQANFIPFFPEFSDLPRIWSRLHEAFGQESAGAALWIASMVIGAWSLVATRRWQVALMLLAPCGLVIAAAALHIYPLSARLQLFAVPLLLMLVAEGFGLLHRSLSQRHLHTGVIVLPLALLLVAHSVWNGPRVGDSRRSGAGVIQHIADNWEEGDRVYVHYAAGQVFLYYAPRQGLDANDYVIGSCSHGAGRVYLKELDRFRGRPRVWVVMAGMESEPDLLARYLDAIGTRRESVGITDRQDPGYWSGTFAYRYDLTETARAAAVTRERFELPPDLGSAERHRWGCHGVFTPVSTRPLA
jgi:4-amino-4-deoxy-L-arabinose transferase-like glycosyltransferase